MYISQCIHTFINYVHMYIYICVCVHYNIQIANAIAWRNVAVMVFVPAKSSNMSTLREADRPTCCLTYEAMCSLSTSFDFKEYL